MRHLVLLAAAASGVIAQAPERPQTTITTDNVRFEVYGALKVDVKADGAGWVVTVRP